MTEVGTGGELQVRVFGCTDVGKVREHNEDNFLLADLTTKERKGSQAEVLRPGPRGLVFGVCDGMGGAAAGEIASGLAVEIILDTLADGDPPHDHDELARRLVRAVEAAGARIFTEARSDRTRRGMGTTATVAALLDRRLFLAQVGDSRAYVLREGRLVQVTRDQSLANQLIEAGQLTEEEAETFEHNNIILQALGTAETVQVDLTFVDLREGDTLLVCSDGLSGMIRADEIRDVLARVEEPEAACRELVERANTAGGHDNVTVIVGRFQGAALQSHESGELKYQKYALPGEAMQDSLFGVPQRAGAAPPAPASQSDPLKVGHTMLGVASPFAAGLPAPGALPSHRPTPITVTSQEDPVEIPTTGLPPKVLGLIVISMVVVAVAGLFLLR